MTATRRLPACVHVEIGANLQTSRDYLVHLAVDLANTYGKASREARAADKALRAVDELRHTLDDASAGELPGNAWSAAIYYGANAEVRQPDIARVLQVHQADSPNCLCIEGNN